MLINSYKIQHILNWYNCSLSTVNIVAKLLHQAKPKVYGLLIINIVSNYYQIDANWKEWTREW